MGFSSSSDQSELNVFERYDDLIYYTDEISRDEVAEFADYFEAITIFGDDNDPWELALFKEDETYIVSLIFYEDTILDPIFLEDTKNMRDDMVEKLSFIENNLKVHLSDENGDLIRVIE